ncbi:MAG: ACT domain-containing protein [Planctomycetes bacterium]|nr:ACT domain-containing protein [Planctomycetota bacterium]
METPARTLEEALRRTRATALPRPFGVVGVPPGAGLDLGALLAGPAPRQVVCEEDEVTVLGPWEEVQSLAAAGEEGPAGPFAWIRFETPMAWELVGFLGAVTGALAEEGISLGAVCGYSRDHVFVPWDRLPEALACLGRLGIAADEAARGDGTHGS